MKFMILVLLALLVVPCIASADQRSGSYGVPFIPPDASLKTTDPFYGGIMERQYGTVNGNMPLSDDPWAGLILSPDGKGNNSESSFWNMTDHNEKLQNIGKIAASNSYDLTEAQMKRAGIALGSESWL
jgi:hypothetical protein